MRWLAGWEGYQVLASLALAFEDVIEYGITIMVELRRVLLTQLPRLLDDRVVPHL